MEKEYLYIGHYIDEDENYMLKIGTTNDLERRRKEHCRYYRKAKKYTMPKENEFVYDWHLPLSKYNTLRYEDRNKRKWLELGIGEYINNDRFCCGKCPPPTVEIKIRKIYEIALV